MPENDKCYVHGSVIEVCFRTEEGLPFVARPCMRLLIESNIARAQALYPVVVSHYVVMGNHLHLILKVLDPEDIPRFVGYVKRELSHAVNRLCGRKKRTVFAEGYDSPIVLDAEKLLERIVYIYTNPQQAGLVDNIDSYPQLSSWEAFLKGGEEKLTRRIPRDCIPELPKGQVSAVEEERIMEILHEHGREEHVLSVEPDACFACYSELDGACVEELKEEVVRRVRQKEQELARERQLPVLGAAALKAQGIRKEFIPKKRGKRMLCLSSYRYRHRRVNFIHWHRLNQELARLARKLLREGNWRARIPPGFFLPGGRVLSNVTPGFLAQAV